MGLRFDGLNNVVNHGNVPNLSGSRLTVMWWSYLTILTVNDEFLQKFVSASSGWRNFLGGVTTTYEMQLGGATNINNEVTNFWAANQWLHAAYVFDGTLTGNANRSKVFKNGVAQTVTFPTATVPAAIGNNTQPLRAGGITAGRAPTGILAHIKIWNASLTPAEVWQEMLSARPQRTAGLQVWCPYDDTASDYSGNGNHGTITGAVLAEGPPISYGAPALVG